MISQKYIFTNYGCGTEYVQLDLIIKLREQLKKEMCLCSVSKLYGKNNPCVRCKKIDSVFGVEDKK
jgi:hypothetical protein